MRVTGVMLALLGALVWSTAAAARQSKKALQEDVSGAYDLLVFPPGCLNKFLALDLDIPCAKKTISKCLG
jgi:hypothetical protein